jgi:hypothetical protein
MLSPSRHAKLYQRVRPSKSCPLINFSFGGLSDDPKNPDKQTLSRDQNHKRLIISNIFEHHCHITRSYISVAAYQACRYRLTTSAIATCRYSRILCDILLSSVQHTCPIDTTSSSVIVTWIICRLITPKFDASSGSQAVPRWCFEDIKKREVNQWKYVILVGKQVSESGADATIDLWIGVLLFRETTYDFPCTACARDATIMANIGEWPWYFPPRSYSQE